MKSKKNKVMLGHSYKAPKIKMADLKKVLNVGALIPVEDYFPEEVKPMTPNKMVGGGFPQKTKGHNEWLTPKWLIDALGGPDFFDLDPCSPIVRPWSTAKKHFTIEDDGLKQNWKGTVFMNPPYSKEETVWVKKLAKHDQGIALIHARTDKRLWHDTIFPNASGLLFLKGRLTFCTVDGKPALDKNGKPSSSGAPSVLVSFGSTCEAKLSRLEDEGLGKLISFNIREGRS